MRVLLDTNVLVAAFVAHGQCSELFEHCALEHDLVAAGVVLDELRRALGAKLGFPREEVREAVALVKLRAHLVEPAPLEDQVSRDPDDDATLAVAVGGACDVLVTGDQDLLTLHSQAGIPIVRPADFWAFETAEGAGE